jgi:hypothetical protein
MSMKIDSPPSVFWVVAEGTNAGKTTVAEAAIRVLNKAQRPALGFKPFGGFDLRENIDFVLSEYPLRDAKLYGKDALRLVRASPLTSDALVEVVGPSYRLLNGPHLVLVRNGSLLLGNRSFLKPKKYAEFDRHNDIKRVAEIGGLPFAAAEITKDFKAREIDFVQLDKVSSSYDYLLKLRPEFIVMEGASGYLPFWPEGPAVDHIFLIRRDSLLFYPGVNLKLGFSTVLNRIRRRHKSTPRTRYIKATLNARRHLERRLEIMPSAQREPMTEALIADLLAEARII